MSVSLAPHKLQHSRERASMQILRFDDEVIAPPKKKSLSRGSLTIVSIGVLLGVGTAFASSTIQINGGQGVTLGQGVSQVTGCDSSINVATAAGLDTPSVSASDTSTASEPKFYLSTLTLGAIDSIATRTDGTGCGGKALKIQFFYASLSSDGKIKTEKARTCAELGTPTHSKISSLTCVNDPTGDALYLNINKEDSAAYSDILTFSSNLSSDLDYVTLVSTDQKVL